MPEGSSSRRDIGEDGVQLGVVAEQRRELVDDDDEPWKLDARVEDVSRAAAREFRLTPPDFGAQALDRAPGAGAVEIGDDPGDVRELAEGVEGRSSFEVSEQEAHLARRARGAQREHPGHEELALSAAGHAGHDGVRPVRDEVQDGRDAVLEPDDSAEAGEGRHRAAARRERRAHGSDSSAPGSSAASAARSGRDCSACARETPSTAT